MMHAPKTKASYHRTMPYRKGPETAWSKSELGQEAKCSVRAHVFRLPLKADSRRTSLEVRFVPIVLQKSFCRRCQKF